MTLAGDEAVRLAAELREHLNADPPRVRDANLCAADLRALCAAIQTELGGQVR
jgi:hypothetical protein